MRLLNCFAIAIVFCSVCNQEAVGVEDDLFGSEESTKAGGSLVETLDETPLSRMVVLAHTAGLPNCDKAEIYALKIAKPGKSSNDPFEEGNPEVKLEGLTFPVRGYGSSVKVLASATLSNNDAVSLCAAWRSLDFDEDASAFCHDPVYGLRFYRQNKLLFETTVCWRCSNFYLPDTKAIEQGKTGESNRYRWHGFVMNQASVKLLSDLRKKLPHPSFDEAPR